METVMKSERDLLLDLQSAEKKLADMVELAKKAQDEAERAEYALIEYMQAKNLKTTGKYTGIGSATLVKPRLYANYLKENEEAVFEVLQRMERADLIKATVNKQSLSGFVKELVENGKRLPYFSTEGKLVIPKELYPEEKQALIEDVGDAPEAAPVITYHLKPSIKLNAA